MLSPEQIKELAHPLVARVELRRGPDGDVTGNLWIEGAERFAHLVESSVKNESRALMWELLYAIEDGLVHSRACAVNCGGTRCDCLKHRLTKKARAWLEEPQKGDDHAPQA